MKKLVFCVCALVLAACGTTRPDTSTADDGVEASEPPAVETANFGPTPCAPEKTCPTPVLVGAWSAPENCGERFCSPLLRCEQGFVVSLSRNRQHRLTEDADGNKCTEVRVAPPSDPQCPNELCNFLPED